MKKIKFKIFTLLCLQFTLSNSMFRHAARALTANNCTLSYYKKEFIIKHTEITAAIKELSFDKDSDNSVPLCKIQLLGSDIIPLEYLYAFYDFLKEPYFFQDHIVINVQDEEHYHKYYELKIKVTEQEWRNLQRKIHLLISFGYDYPIIKEEFFESREEFVKDRFIKFFNHIKSLPNQS